MPHSIHIIISSPLLSFYLLISPPLISPLLIYSRLISSVLFFPLHEDYVMHGSEIEERFSIGRFLALVKHDQCVCQCECMCVC
jgi:hypothetical protein